MPRVPKTTTKLNVQRVAHDGDGTGHDGKVAHDGRHDGDGSSPSHEINWSRASNAAALRRAQLRLTQAEVGALLEETGIALETYRRFERAEKSYHRRTTLAAISVALGWPPGALYDIACGGEPPAPESELDYLREQVVRITSDVAVLRSTLSQLTKAVAAVERRRQSTGPLPRVVRQSARREPPRR